MINHINGKITEKTPTHIVVEANGVGYYIHISLTTYSKLVDLNDIKILTYLSIKEDAHTLYGFFDAEERDMFKLLISVNGVGTNTARMMLSSLQSQEISKAILQGNVNELKGIKGIGIKTAQRIIVDLKDKVGKDENISSDILTFLDNTNRDEALSALVALGFTKAAVEKVLHTILKAQPKLSVEALVKEALKKL
jgi:Holliday junction DNA helicase RuvA